MKRLCAGRGDRRRRRRRDARLPSIRLGAGGRRLLLPVAVHVAVHRQPFIDRPQCIRESAVIVT